MPFALTLRLHDTAAAAVRRMWEALAARGLSTDSLDLGYPAHLTLAIHPDTADAAALAAAADGWALARPIAFAGFGLFPGAPSVLFLAPVPDAALLGAHADLHRRLPPGGHAHYAPGAWVPHATLAADLPDAAPALAALAGMALPPAAPPASVDLVRFRPVEVLRRRPLAPD